MSRQIDKKFIKDDAIDGSKIKLQNGQAIRSTNSSGQEVELLKLDENDTVSILGEEVVVKGNAPEHLDTLEEIATAIENIDPSNSINIKEDYKVIVDGTTVNINFIDLPDVAKSILNMTSGIVSLKKNIDYIVSIQNGKTRITWINDYSNGLAIGSIVFVTYTY